MAETTEAATARGGAGVGPRWLAPLRGVTIRAFRRAFAPAIREADFAGVVAPFIPANPGLRVNERLLADLAPSPETRAPLLVPQVITKHPEALRELLKGLRDRGFARVDLNAGCPFPMIRRRGRGSGLLRTPDVLEKLLEVGCDTLGPDRFSLKTRLGLSSPHELETLMPRLARYPLAMLTIHARTAEQMYTGACDRAAFAAACAQATCPVVYNGDVSYPVVPEAAATEGVMIGRAFVRHLGMRDDVAACLARYVALSQEELSGDHPVLGRLKELLAYWQEIPRWRRLWPAVKICRSVDELRLVLNLREGEV